MTKNFMCLNKPPEKGTYYFTFDLSENNRIFKYPWEDDEMDFDFLHK